ncbi:autotransporter-associated beta strand repeat-containing protein [Xylophilus sp. GOD-11R]|uniref:autotransporter-associated beta strand repeat-containing protein n=1 Tax=Xylophilus sp. GOD-11R TaxID=3089814 RepID=UPI00298CD344|nr:autotransporter-associated beta strand repeat-containing protein [Xylophilus sp. GOD-11R]WPB59414.1 hypothetical protein R9X41_09590 [Xylophilus sp. GOD-11R]
MGSGSLTLDGTNSFTGGTEVSAGLLVAGSSRALAKGAVYAGAARCVIRARMPSPSPAPIPSAPRPPSTGARRLREWSLRCGWRSGHRRRYAGRRFPKRIHADRRRHLEPDHRPSLSGTFSGISVPGRDVVAVTPPAASNRASLADQRLPVPAPPPEAPLPAAPAEPPVPGLATPLPLGTVPAALFGVPEVTPVPMPLEVAPPVAPVAPLLPVARVEEFMPVPVPVPVPLPVPVPVALPDAVPDIPVEPVPPMELPPMEPPAAPPAAPPV